MKEIGTLLGECFDEKLASKIKMFEARRIQELYARMVRHEHKVPDFKARLIRLKKDKKALPGFGNIDRSGQK